MEKGIRLDKDFWKKAIIVLWVLIVCLNYYKQYIPKIVVLLDKVIERF